MKNKASRGNDAVSPKPDGEARRTALRRLLAGGTLAGAAAVLPSTWTQPVVQSVLLPAHAQLSGEPDGDFFPVSTIIDDDVRAPHKSPTVASSVGWLDWLVPSARAGLPRPPEPCRTCDGCARIRNMEVTLSLLGYQGDSPLVCFEGAGVIGDSVTLNPVSSGDGLECDSPSVTLVALEGEAPNRRLVVDAGFGEFWMDEDPSRSCNCGGLGCEF